VFTLGLALLIDNLEILSLLLLAQPVIRDLSKVCQSFLALEEENRQLVAQLDDVRREYFSLSCSSLLQKAVLL
jgi:hypothetical protein